ncbi:thioredoxin-like protein [Limtongia smithiae]|uniref:thioredoxin-like protein n=1 Tax=Limtongia smithiae TaxID=1125753 RepID=UPI0034CFF96C
MRFSRLPRSLLTTTSSVLQPCASVHAHPFFCSSPLFSNMATAEYPQSFYDLSPADSKGKPYDFHQLEGHVVLIVNVASKCGFTPQYKGLETLYETYHDKGLEIIGFPCNQFGRQEPGTDEEIATFCTANYGVTFPIMKKIDVNGDGADPVYKFLKSKKAGILGFRGIKWNFEKFLIGADGNVIERFASITTPGKIISPQFCPLQFR